MPLLYQLEELLLVSIPAAKWGESTQQNVENNTECPDVHRNPISCQTHLKNPVLLGHSKHLG